MLSWLIVDICNRPQAVVAFSAYHRFYNPKIQRRCVAIPTTSKAGAGTDDEMFSEEEHRHHDEHENEDEEIEQTAYGNRSLFWTRKYRTLIPYEHARRRAIGLGLRSKEEWNEYLEDGNLEHGSYLPNNPEEMYQEEWTGWDDFLGIMRPYEEARHIVKSVLKLKTMEEYKQFIKADAKRAEGLRIPARPDIVYKSKWWDEKDFFFSQNDVDE